MSANLPQISQATKILDHHHYKTLSHLLRDDNLVIEDIYIKHLVMTAIELKSVLKCKTRHYVIRTWYEWNTWHQELIV